MLGECDLDDDFWCADAREAARTLRRGDMQDLDVLLGIRAVAPMRPAAVRPVYELRAEEHRCRLMREAEERMDAAVREAGRQRMREEETARQAAQAAQERHSAEERIARYERQAIEWARQREAAKEHKRQQQAQSRALALAPRIAEQVRELALLCIINITYAEDRARRYTARQKRKKRQRKPWSGTRVLPRRRCLPKSVTLPPSALLSEIQELAAESIAACDAADKKAWSAYA